MFSFLVFWFLLYSDNPPFFASKSIDVKELGKLAENDIVTIVRECEDFEGRKNYLSISATKIHAPKNAVMKVFLNPKLIKKILKNVKDTKVVKSYPNKAYDVEYKVSLPIIAGISITVRYITHVVPGENYIFSYIKEGKNKGSWRMVEFFENRSGTLTIFSICEYIRVNPIANKVFSDNPHYEIGIASSTGIIVLEEVKKFIEEYARR